MDTLRLSLFVDLAQSKSFSATARKFYRSQPAVSISIRKLEEELGVLLLQRGAASVRLTPEGEILRKQAVEILSLVDDLKFQASQLAKKPKGYVRFAAIHSVGLYELSDTIRVFIKKFKDIRLGLQYDEFRRVYELVESQEIEFGVVAYPQATNAIEVIPMMEHEMVVIVPKEGPFRGRAEVKLTELEGQSFVTFLEGTPTRQAIDGALKKAGVAVDMRFEDNNIEMLKKAVEVGMGVSIVPLKTVEKEKSGRFRLLHIKNRPLKRPIGIVKLKTHRLSRAAGLFVEELLDHR